MALIIKPHQLKILDLNEEADPSSHRIEVPDYPETESVVACKVSPLSFDPMKHQDPETGFALARPHLLLCELADAPLFEHGMRVIGVDPLLNGRLFVFIGAFKMHAYGLPGDCAEGLLNEMEPESNASN